MNHEEIAQVMGTVENFELVPHVIPVDINLVADLQTNYQVMVQLPEEKFLLKRIHTRHCTVAIRLINTRIPKVYYESPGWLHYIHHDFEIRPALMLTKENPWMLDVKWNPFSDFSLQQLNVALIGERIVPL